MSSQIVDSLKKLYRNKNRRDSLTKLVADLTTDQVNLMITQILSFPRSELNFLLQLESIIDENLVSSEGGDIFDALLLGSSDSAEGQKKKFQVNPVLSCLS
jgi:hypothetical protein